VKFRLPHLLLLPGRTVNGGGTICAVRVTIAWLAVSVALSAHDPHLTSLRRAEEVALARVLDAALWNRRTPDRGLRWEGHFLKGRRGQTYVPFTVHLDGVGDSFRSVAVAIRVAGPNIRWYDAFGIDTQPSGDGRSFHGAISVNPGACRVLIAIQDREPRGRSPVPVVLEQRLTVPGFSGRALQMSSVVVSDRVGDVPPGLAEKERKAYPYAFGSANVVPVPPNAFKTHQTLTVAFQVYNVAMFEDGKPDVEVHYEVFREGETAHPVGRTAPQNFNQETVPEEFTLKTGYQLTPIQSLPLSQFEPGAYRLAIEVDDVLGNARVRADIPFTVSR
jgi:hypothetical protein